MLRWRLLLGTIIIAALAGLCWLDHSAPLPGLYLLPVAALVTVAATGEVLLLAGDGVRPAAWAAYAGNLLIVLAGWAPVAAARAKGAGGPGAGTETLAASAECILLALALAVAMTFAGEMLRFRGPGGVTARLGTAMLAFVYVGVLLGFVALVRLTHGVAALVSLVIVVKTCDTGAYAAGRFLGRHKLAPAISPGKTLEGAVGGLLLGCLGSWAAFAWLVPALAPPDAPPCPWWGWLAYGLLVGAAGALGDLAESLLKRDARRKDSSAWMPGFGGVLDIMDSILLAAPVAFACWQFGLVG